MTLQYSGPGMRVAGFQWAVHLDPYKLHRAHLVLQCAANHHPGCHGYQPVPASAHSLVTLEGAASDLASPPPLRGVRSGACSPFIKSSEYSLQ
ncbi:hypothetical protein B5X24_HaOG202688 [Helicoverpa armigera]|uniref:Uncharacterized protein n=1 Tax=Helicoverpa armigera TaxID=29058 RepID=A0A2W1BZ97_HELAM|nr:hypothetical protein B5X24_HaOG202688 [Helicoverpa armigera]